MSTETNKAICRRFLEKVYNEQRLDLVQEFLAEDLVQHIAGGPPAQPGLESFKEGLTMALAAFPDIQLAYDDEIAESDKVVFRWTMTATHQGEFMGIPPTGKSVSFGVFDVIRIAGGKSVEHWGQMDEMGMMQQLGAMPE